MNYTLAKKLKDAGFPQGGDGVYCGNVELIKQEDVKPGGVVGIAQEYFVYLPTLSELIDACGLTSIGFNGFTLAFVEEHNIWLARIDKAPPITLEDLDKGVQSKISSKTPEEAVANLWLALNRNGTSH